MARRRRKNRDNAGRRSRRRRHRKASPLLRLNKGRKSRRRKSSKGGKRRISRRRRRSGGGKRRVTRAVRRAARRRRVAGRFKTIRRLVPSISAADAHRIAKKLRPNKGKRRRSRRNPAGIIGGAQAQAKALVGLLGQAGMAWVAGRVVGNTLNMVLDKVPAIGDRLGKHKPVVASLAAVVIGDQLSRPGRPLAKFRTPILIGTGLVAIDKIINAYLAPVLPAQVKGFLGLGQIPAFWQQNASEPYQQSAVQGVGEYVEVPPGVGMGAIQEAAAGMGEYIEVPPGVGIGAVQEAAAGLGEYVEVAPGMQGLGMVQEAAAGMGNFPRVGTGYEGARIAALPPGNMPIPITRSPAEAAFESAHAGGDGLFDEGGIFN